MNFDYNKKPTGEYWNDFTQRFIAESYREIRDGRECYVYSKDNLELIIAELERNNIKYILKENNSDYWTIKPKNGRYLENARKEKKK